MGNALSVQDAEKQIAERLTPAQLDGLSVSRTAGGIVFANAGEVMSFAKAMAISKVGVRAHLRGNVGACLAIVQQSIEWGMSAYAVANKSYLVNDQLAFESQLIQAVILRRAPIKGRIKFDFEGEGLKRVCIASCRLNDGSDERVEVRSPIFEKILPKNSPLWKNDPDQQQAYYTGRALCRRHFPDVLLGIYDVDEMVPGEPLPPSAPRVVSPAAIGSRLDELAARPARQPGSAHGQTIEHDPETGEIAGGGDRVDEANGADVLNDEDEADEGEGGGEPERQEPGPPQVDVRSDDWQTGYQGGLAGMRKGLTAEIKADPVRLANWEAGQAKGRAQAEQEGR